MSELFSGKGAHNPLAFHTQESGAAVLEYVLLLSGIVMGVMLLITLFGNKLADSYAYFQTLF